MSYITRSGRVDLDRLRKLSPQFVARYERERNARAGCDRGYLTVTSRAALLPAGKRGRQS